MAKVEVRKVDESAPGGDYEGTPTARLALAWAVVGVPLLYGVSQVFIKSLALFR